MDLNAIELELGKLAEHHKKLASHFKGFHERLVEVASYKQTLGRDAFPAVVHPLEGAGEHFTIEFAGTSILVQFAFEPSDANGRTGIVRWTRLDPITAKPAVKAGEFTFHHSGGTDVVGPAGVNASITEPGGRYFLGAHILRSSVVRPAATATVQPLRI